MREKAGAVNVLYGSSDGLGLGTAVGQIWSRESDGVLAEPAEGDRFGHSLAAGDYEGTGLDDLAIGVPGDDVDGFADAGSASVLYGSAKGITPLHNQLWDQTGLDKDGGVETLDSFGLALAAGDFDGDGVEDLAIGVPGEVVGIEIVILNAGSVDVLYGTVNYPPDAEAGAYQTVPVSNDNCYALVQLDGTGSILAPIAARLVQLAESRQREYLADASAVDLTRNPYGLERALEKIAVDREVLEVANRATQHCTSPTRSRSGRSGRRASGRPIRRSSSG